MAAVKSVAKPAKAAIYFKIKICLSPFGESKSQKIADKKNTIPTATRTMPIHKGQFAFFLVLLMWHSILSEEVE